MGIKKFLHVGCGPNRKAQTPFARVDEAWEETTLDIDGTHRPDILGAMTDMSRVPSGSFDAVFSSHSIEHLFAHEVPIALAEFKRVLKPDGFALIICPDLQSVCALIASGNLTDAAYMSPAGPISPIDILYGYRAAVAAGQGYMAHKTGFIRKSLQEALLGAGFGVTAGASYPAPMFEIWMLAFVSRPPESKVHATAAQFFPK